MFIRRLGQNENLCGHNCPQILEMADGDFAVVGLDITSDAIKTMPPGPGVSPNEVVVKVPRRIFIAARPEIPAA